MKLMIRNTSRDKTTAALRKARPGDVQPYPVIKKIRLPPGGSLNLDSSDLTSAEVSLLAKLVGCGCLKVLTVPGFGPMRQLGVEEIKGFAPAAPVAPAEPAPEPIPEPAPVVTPPMPEPEPEPEPAPEPEPIPELDEALEEEPTEDEPAPYLESELKATKNAILRDTLSGMGFDATSGMKKADLVAKILELQEA